MPSLYRSSTNKPMIIAQANKKSQYHFMHEPKKAKVMGVEAMFYSHNSYCGNFGGCGWDKNVFIKTRDWRGQKICVSCVLKAYQAGDIDIYPVPENVKKNA